MESVWLAVNRTFFFVEAFHTFSPAFPSLAFFSCISSLLFLLYIIISAFFSPLTLPLHSLLLSSFLHCGAHKDVGGKF